MLGVRLRFILKAQNAATIDARTNAIAFLIGALIRNGNLMKDAFVTENGWTAYGVAPAREAFNKANRSEFVQQRIGALTEVGLGRPVIGFLGDVPETPSDCRCARSKGFFLFTTFLHTEPPVRCIECAGIVPLYRLPCPETGEYSSLLTWMQLPIMRRPANELCGRRAVRQTPNVRPEQSTLAFRNCRLQRD
jgi:predicted  nucleic acid-binding Zn ribbon protein